MRLGYSEAPGSLELRSLLAATYRETGPEEVLVTTGAIEANFLLFNVLLEAGDHVVVVHPAYQQLESVPKAIGGRAVGGGVEPRLRDRGRGRGDGVGGRGLPLARGAGRGGTDGADAGSRGA